MPDDSTVLTTDIERLIASISGVSAAKVVTDAEGRIVEIHVLADTGKSPKQIVRDIQSCTMAAYGIPVDYKTISVAQIEPELRQAAAPQPAAVLTVPRLLYVGLTVRTERMRAEATVALELNGKRFEGTARAPANERGRRNACASACLAALHAYLGDDGLLQLLETQKSRIAGFDAVTAAVGFLDGDRETVLLGTAPVRPDATEDDAAVKAVLDALNRILRRAERS